MADQPILVFDDPLSITHHRPIRKEPSPLQALVASIPSSNKTAHGRENMAPTRPTNPNKKQKLDVPKKCPLTWVNSTVPTKQLSKGSHPAGSKNKRTTTAKSKAASVVKNDWPSAEDMKKLARFDWLLRLFINSANALEEEFGGIPEEIDIIADRFGKFHAEAVSREYPDEIEGDNRIDISKYAIERSIDLEKVGLEDKIPKPIQRPALKAAPQYSIQDGTIQLPDPIHQKPENILFIMNSLKNTPLGFPTGDPNESINISGNSITLTSGQWDIVKDCLTIVHYMNDYSILGPINMYQEAKAAYTRQFGWAPDVDVMIQAKHRALEYRKEGRHVTALGTQAWNKAWKEAYDRGGEGTVWKEEEHGAGKTQKQKRKVMTNSPVWGGSKEKGLVPNITITPAMPPKLEFLPSMAAHTIQAPTKERPDIFLQIAIGGSQPLDRGDSVKVDSASSLGTILDSVPISPPPRPRRVAQVIDTFELGDKESEKDNFVLKSCPNQSLPTLNLAQTEAGTSTSILPSNAKDSGSTRTGRVKLKLKIKPAELPNLAIEKSSAGKKKFPMATLIPVKGQEIYPSKSPSSPSADKRARSLPHYKEDGEGGAVGSRKKTRPF